MNYADSSFVVSLFVPDANHEAALAATAGGNLILALTPLLRLEVRNALNRGVQQKRMTLAQRDAVWLGFAATITAGHFVEAPLSTLELHGKARELSDRYTPSLGTRSLDLLHVAAAVLLGGKVFFSFDERQRKAAAGEGLRVKP